MAHDQVAVYSCPKKILTDYTEVIRHLRQPLCAIVIAKFIISQPDIENAFDQLTGLG